MQFINRCALYFVVQLFAALSTGCVSNLVSLDVSRCVYSYKKPTRDVAVPMYWRDFFSKAVALQSVNFAGCRLPNEAVKCVKRLWFISGLQNVPEKRGRMVPLYVLWNSKLLLD